MSEPDDANGIQKRPSEISVTDPEAGTVSESPAATPPPTTLAETDPTPTPSLQNTAVAGSTRADPVRRHVFVQTRATPIIVIGYCDAYGSVPVVVVDPLTK